MAKRRFRKHKSYSNKARENSRRRYFSKDIPLFEELAAQFKPVYLAEITELAPYVEDAEIEEIRNYPFHAYPVDPTLINKTIGCCRVLHNKFVETLYDYLERTGYEGGRITGYKVPLYPEVKRLIGKEYMNEPDSTAYVNVRENFENAIKRYNETFASKGQYTKRALRRVKNGGAPLSFRDLKGMPKFHAKFQATDSYKSNAVNGNILLEAKPDTSGNAPDIYAKAHGNAKDFKKTRALLKLPKMEAFEVLLHRPLPRNSKIKSVVVTREKWGEYTVTLSLSYKRTLTRIKNTDEARAAVRAYLEEHLDLALGLDYSQTGGCVGSGGDGTRNTLDLLIAAAFGKRYRQMEARLAHLNRIKRKKRGPDHKNGVDASISYFKLQRRIAKLSARIARRRKDALDKLSRVLTDAFLLVAVEDIDLRAMAQGLKLAKNLLDNGFGEFRGMLEYKLAEQGKLYVVVDKWFASSQKCHACGGINPETTDLRVRHVVCKHCGAEYGRDENAALNIRDEGIRVFGSDGLFQKQVSARATATKYKKHA